MENKLRVKFIVSEDIEGQPIGPNRVRNILINPILVMRSQFIPSSLSLAITIVAYGIDFSENHQFNVSLINIEKNEVIYETGLTPIEANQHPQVDNFSFNLQLRNIPFETEGDYKISLLFNDEEHHDTFKVLKVGS